MSFVDAIKSCFSQYVNFNGRARRSEYWFFCLFNIIVSIAFNVLAQFVGFFSILGAIAGLALILPGLAVAVRRLHDIGKSGLWILISLIPLVGGIWLIVLMCQDSIPGANEYGANPKGM